MKSKTYLIILCLIFINILGTNAQKLKVISYNIHHGANQDEVNTLAEIGEYIKASQADLVGLQEVDSMCNRSGNVDQMKVLAEITGMHYAFLRHFEYDGGAYGLGILSRFPISKQHNGKITSIKNGEKRSLALLSARISLPEDKEMVIATVHLALDQSTRLIQTAETLDQLTSDVPVILTGDFNAEPGTEEINMLYRSFAMADDAGKSNTFPVVDPIKKIDYIWISKDKLDSISGITVPHSVQYSDHLPLQADIILKVD